MCLAVPGRVIALEPNAALVQLRGRTVRAAIALLPDVAVGDDVLVTGGLIINRVSPGEAEARRELFDRMLSLADGPTPAEREAAQEDDEQ